MWCAHVTLYLAIAKWELPHAVIIFPHYPDNKKGGLLAHHPEIQKGLWFAYSETRQIYQVRSQIGGDLSFCYRLAKSNQTDARPSLTPLAI